jgi:2-polyprenyl-3-methyl-5-hydroxy-6-metoxy-1,4-benzoquinol methylase
MKELIDTATVQADFDRIALLSNKDVDEGWNHNNHYHRFLLEQVPARCTEALDIGCGAGQFARLLASRAEHVLALDLSPQMIRLARERSTGFASIDFEAADVLSRSFSPEQFDYIVSVAALHHMPMEAILLKMKKALAKGGTLAVLDIYKARFSDLFVNLVAIPANLYMQRVKNGRRPPASAEARAAMKEHGAHDSYLTLSEVHQMCEDLLPGARVRRHLFWRYSIVWTKPQ